MNRRQTIGKVGPVPMTMVNVKDGIPQKSIEARGIVLIASSRFRSIERFPWLAIFVPPGRRPILRNVLLLFNAYFWSISEKKW